MTPVAMGQPAKIWAVRARTQGPASGLALGKKHQAASCRCSVRWIRSMMTVTGWPRAAAWAWMRAIWSLFPSASAIHLAWRAGSRRSASANTAAMTSAAVAATLAGADLALRQPPFLLRDRLAGLTGGLGPQLPAPHPDPLGI